MSEPDTGDDEDTEVAEEAVVKKHGDRQAGIFAGLVVGALIAISGRHEIGAVIRDIAVAGQTYSPSVLWSFLNLHNLTTAMAAWDSATDLHVRNWLTGLLLCQIAVWATMLAAVVVAHQRWNLLKLKWIVRLVAAWAVQIAFAMLMVRTHLHWYLVLALLKPEWFG